ncbi:MAG: NADH-quinone oxidoreductase subunit M [Propionibacteriaceae bacterium]|jgi:NADH-quinone oxidoreductase subunit M|nr:NADH-quinone oxidoreductase subunit M [Propionibacteriaceae bacterium]
MIVPWLTLIFVVPLFGAAIVLPLRGARNRLAGLIISGLTLAMALTALLLSQSHNLAEQVLWLRRFGAWYALQFDGLSASLVIATAVLSSAVLAIGLELDTATDATSAPTMRPEVFTSLVLLTEALVIGAFLAADLVLFFLFFEVSLLPVYLLIGYWGGACRAMAASRFLMFSLASGFLLFGGIVGVVTTVSTVGRSSTLLSALANVEFTPGMERLLFVLFFMAFALKGPLVPLHSWLTAVVKEANPAVSALLIGAVDALGGYAMIRFTLGLFPNAALWAAPGVLVIALISIWYGGFAAVGERHLVSMASYTSISHFGFIVFGIFTLTPTAINGAAMYLVAHLLSVGALVLVCGVLQQSSGVAHFGDRRGLRQRAPATAALFLLVGLATLPLPGFLGFAAELQVLVGAGERHPIFALFAVIGTLFATVYVTWSYQRLFTGTHKLDMSPTDAVPTVRDATTIERSVIAVLLLLLLAFGCAPQMLRNYIASAEPGTTAVAITNIAEGGE